MGAQRDPGAAGRDVPGDDRHARIAVEQCVEAEGEEVLGWPNAASMRADWDLPCTTMVQETGHLLGHGHSDAAASIMAPVVTDRSSVPQRCRETRPGRSTL